MRFHYIKWNSNSKKLHRIDYTLTIAKLLKDGFQISVIPKTLKLTNLIYLKERDLVNIELDIFGKYIKSFIK